jgi:hypothetical protein
LATYLDVCEGVLFEQGSLGQQPASTTANDIDRITARLAFITKRQSALLDREDVDENDIAEKLNEWRAEKARLTADLLAAQQQQRTQQNSTGAGDHVQAVRRLRAMATSVEEGEDRTIARAEINGALRAIIDSIHLLPDDVMVWIGGGAKVAIHSADGWKYGYFHPNGTWLQVTSQGAQEPAQ